VAPADSANGAGVVRDQLSDLRGLLVLSMLLTRQDDAARILHLVASAVESLGPCWTERIFLDGHWAEVRVPAHEPAGPGLCSGRWAEHDGPVQLAGVPWSWAYPMSVPHGPSGYLVVGAEQEPAEEQRFLLGVLAQQAGVALANTQLHTRQREYAEQLQVTNLALRRTMEIHDTLTQVALEGRGQEGIAQAVHDLTGYPVAIEDRFGNLQAWAGPDRPERYPKDTPEHRDRLLRRAMAAAGPMRDGERLFSLARLNGAAMGVLVLHDPVGTAEKVERVAIEHATTVLTMELARLQTLADANAQLRSDLVAELVEGADLPGVLNRAQALGYDLGRPHRVVVVAVAGERENDRADGFFRAVRRAAQDTGVGSLLAPRPGEVVILADAEAPWAKFRAAVLAEWPGGDCRIGVGSRRSRLDEFPLSYQEAQLALKMIQAAGGRDQVTRFDDLGVYQVLGTAENAAAVERFVRDWLGVLIEYDASHGAQLVMTLSEYLECGGNYDATAKALLVHRNTLKYRLRRIRAVSGHDLSHPDTQFNLQLATRAWRTMLALRES
jgi:DNA-binding PucR family transcriptional regulator